MRYLATLTLDYSAARNHNMRAQLMNAICQAGWSYAETSALYIECDNLDKIRLGLEMLARAVQLPGTLSALNLQVQLVEEDRDPPAAANHPYALDKTLALPLPSAPSV
ncbi:hypothetical protein [Actinokineospora sp. HUAS TT18]|uniref:hypothetical protein n=1 Tax=Actinokineospora sp. HUAS TT18 TaxID=3447451 RepID=UPI003F52292B